MDQFILVAETILPEEYSDRGQARRPAICQPGSAQKRKRLAKRYARRLQLFHMDDPQKGPSDLVSFGNAKKLSIPLPTEDDPEDLD